jgi:hypothetical protein
MVRPAIRRGVPLGPQPVCALVIAIGRRCSTVASLLSIHSVLDVTLSASEPFPCGNMSIRRNIRWPSCSTW